MLGLQCTKAEMLQYKNCRLIAGTFVGCCPHTVSYGFHLMVDPEGRKDVMKVLYKRMPQEVLDKLCIVYDFGCQEAEYMLNREPNMFRKTRVFIDRFHAMSHKCSSVFKLQAYLTLKKLVSTSSESLNTFLQKTLHTQAAFMKQETYVEMLGGILGVCNWFLNNEAERVRNMFVNM